MKFGSLFSGIGGMDLGLERAGMGCIWQVEWDPYCQKVLAKHWPDVPRFGDIHDVGRNNLETPDLIAGGFPCQPVSLAGKRQAQSDARWLWPEFARVVDELRPRYVLVENVPGLYTAGGSEVLADLATLGYDAEWHSIPASAFGAPHRRYRLFIIAYRIGLGRKKRTSETIRQIFPIPERREPEHVCEGFSGEGDVADPSSPRLEGESISETRKLQPTPRSWWTIEPNVGRVAHGVPSRVDRLRGLGNAVVPQVAEWVGRNIMEHG